KGHGRFDFYGCSSTARTRTPRRRQIRPLRATARMPAVGLKPQATLPRRSYRQPRRLAANPGRNEMQPTAVSTMKAIVVDEYGSPKNARLTDVDTPKVNDGF